MLAMNKMSVGVGGGGRLPRKIKTWKFGCEFLVRNALVKDKAALGRWTRDQLIDLGPTFVKLGQIASARSDLYPLEFVRELETLQDEVPAVAYDSIVDLIDESAFETFDPEPFKSASIGQVHRATLSGGKDVVVKIRRPGIIETMREDTANVMELVAFLDSIGIDTGTGANNYVLVESVENLLKECDYENEVVNAVQFRRNFKKVPWLKVPKVYRKLSGSDAIVMEYVASEKLGEITDPRVNKKNVARALMRAYVMQTMHYGLFHADPHPGNIGFRSANGGQLVFYDFGLCIPISNELKEGLFDAIVPLMTRDSKAVVEILTRLGMIVPTTDAGDIEIFFDLIINYLETLDVKSMGDDIMSDPIMLELARDKPFIIPAEFIYLAKAFTLAEGLLVSLDPDFNYYTYLEPIVRENMPNVKLDVGDMAASVAEVPSRVRAISKGITGLEKSRANLKRQVKRNRTEIRYSQYSILFLMVAFEVRESNAVAFALFSCLSLFFQILRFQNDD
tara:strand:+ start:590 stop:2110 length:1521 start_codon:yes stop_codon:yes gene_type:complete